MRRLDCYALRAASVALAAATLALAACSVLDPAAASAAAPPAERSIYVVSHGLHTGIVVRRRDLPAGLWPESEDFPHAEYLEVGWGDREYYRAPGFDLLLGIRALAWPTPSVLHVVGFRGAPADAFPASEVVELAVGAGGLDALARHVDASFERAGARRAPALGPGLYGESRFYASHERFHLFHTCNVWTARALRVAGFAVRPSITAAGLLAQLRALGRDPAPRAHVQPDAACPAAQRDAGIAVAFHNELRRRKVLANLYRDHRERLVVDGALA